MKTWNPRFVAYAEAHGFTDPQGMLKADQGRFPGGHMAGFTLWIQKRWNEWRQMNGLKRDSILGTADHDAFDAWLLKERCTR